MKILSLSIVLVLACWFDLKQRRIPNKLIVSGWCLALITTALDGGIPEMGNALAGASVGLLILLPFFAFRLIGAGDVKLMSVVGSFTGVAALMPISIYTFVMGGVLGVTSLVAARSGKRALTNLRLVALATSARMTGAQFSTSDLGLQTALRLPYAIAIAGGVIGWILTRG